MPLVWSAKSEGAVRAQAGRLAGVLDAGAGLVDVGFSLVSSRASLERRCVVLAGDVVEAERLLGVAAGGGAAAGVVSGEAVGGRLAVLFTGQGSQRLAMGRELYEAFPVFAGALDAVADELDLQLEVPLREVLFGGDAEVLRQTAYAQCALFAVEVALFRLVESWGVRAGVLLGHSIGELAAAHVAGVWSLEDACAVVGARGRLMQELPTGGVMVAVTAAEADVRPLLGPGVDIAAVNG
ncbi:acyltransferase domain-containing protein, partial [Streptomyces sp. M2CJ-2]|uniref:acyltransferase domain-containing protein n=1 Tax=Streptomyces sp. M2CJ-2 TaxID=2803948 RepID=UPI0027DB4B13